MSQPPYILDLQQTSATVLCRALVDNSIIFLEICHTSHVAILLCFAALSARLYTFTKDGRNELYTLTSGLYWLSWSILYGFSISSRRNPTCRSQKAELTNALTYCRSYTTTIMLFFILHGSMRIWGIRLTLFCHSKKFTNFQTWISITKLPASKSTIKFRAIKKHVDTYINFSVLGI
jgi:hypothetical protein